MTRNFTGGCPSCYFSHSFKALKWTPGTDSR